MTASILLCADSESVLRPELIGLSGERLDAQDWLSVFAEGLHARAFFKKSDKPTEAWVVSSDDVDSINLAAALKRDAPRHRVFLVAFRSSGSLKSRVSAAGIDGLLDRAQFVERYRSCKLGARSSRTQAASPKATPARPSGASSVPGADSEFLRGLDLGGSSSKQASVPQAGVSTAQDAPARLSGSTACRVSGRGASGEGRQAFVLVVASASGGSGKSTVAALAAVFAQGMGHRTLLMDADLQFGDASAMVGAKSPRALDEVVDGASLPSPSGGACRSGAFGGFRTTGIGASWRRRSCGSVFRRYRGEYRAVLGRAARGACRACVAGALPYRPAFVFFAGKQACARAVRALRHSYHAVFVRR